MLVTNSKTKKKRVQGPTLDMRQHASISQRKVDWRGIQVNEFSALPQDLSTKSVFRRLETEHEKVNCQFRSPFQGIFFVKYLTEYY